MTDEPCVEVLDAGRERILREERRVLPVGGWKGAHEAL